MKIKLTEQFYKNHSYTHRYDEFFNLELSLEDGYCAELNRTLQPDEYEFLPPNTSPVKK